MLAQTVGARGPTPPHVYHISTNEVTNDLLLSLETGHVMSVKSKDTSKVRFLLDAHTHKVMHTSYAKFAKNQSVVFTLSCDLSWCLWNTSSKSLVTKIKLQEEPNTGLTTMANLVVVGDLSNDIKFYKIKD